VYDERLSELALLAQSVTTKGQQAAKEREFYNCPNLASILSGTERFLRSAVEGCGHDAMTAPPPSTTPAKKQRASLRMLRYG